MSFCSAVCVDQAQRSHKPFRSCFVVLTKQLSLTEVLKYATDSTSCLMEGRPSCQP